jgi:hypothetical protein
MQKRIEKVIGVSGDKSGKRRSCKKHSVAERERRRDEGFFVFIEACRLTLPIITGTTSTDEDLRIDAGVVVVVVVVSSK